MSRFYNACIVYSCLIFRTQPLDWRINGAKIKNGCCHWALMLIGNFFCFQVSTSLLLHYIAVRWFPRTPVSNINNVEDQLDATIIYWYSNQLNMFRAILCPSSGAQDCFTTFGIMDQSCCRPVVWNAEALLPRSRPPAGNNLGALYHML